MIKNRVIILLSLLFFGYGTNLPAITVEATLTADNFYAFGYGNEDGSILYPVGSSLTVEWNDPDTYIFDMDENDYIYVAAWSDGSVAQGFIGQFVSDSGIILTNPGTWEVYSAGKPFSMDTISSDIGSADWGPISYSVGQGEGVWGLLYEISLDAKWIWPVPLSPGNSTGEYHLFRTKALFYPTPIAEAGEDITIYTYELPSTTICGFATYTGGYPLQYRWVCGEYILQDWTPAGLNNECFLEGSSEAIPPGTYPLTLEVSDGQFTSSDMMVLTILENPLPVELTADAGENIEIYSEDVTGILYGTATYTGTGSLVYRWLWGETVLLDWTPAGQDNACTYISENTVIPPGTYILTLEVTDGQITSSDTMILTIFNSAPHVAVLGGAGTYDIGSEVVLISQASDFDGDLLTFEWKGSGIVSSGSIQSLPGGEPLGIPDCVLSGLDLGIHVFTLEVSDGINDIVSVDVIVEVVDTEVPTLAPVVSAGILWPPNHQMEEITIYTNAYDNSGLPVSISASVTSNEFQEGLGDGDMFPDWTELQIDQETGIIILQLRSERSGTGDGREYTITIVATDSSGNSSSVEKTIIVPHDKSKK